MSKIFTGYFGRLKTYRENGLFPVAIAQYVPDWFNGSQYLPLAPMKYMLSKSMPTSVFDKEYKQHILSKLTPEQVIRQLEFLSKGQDVVLLCYEKQQSDCHRGLVAEWFNRKGFDVQEYGIEQESPPEAVQLGLF
jgi:uncharacterized protein (DUF488 family)